MARPDERASGERTRLDPALAAAERIPMARPDERARGERTRLDAARAIGEETP
jgi:hypothetical protein